MSKISGNKSGRKFRKDTETYQLFEELFLELGEDKLPYVIVPMARGSAINTAMGLNRCHVQWAQENEIPEEIMGRSAKAIAGDSDDTWALEISLNHKRLRLKKDNTFIGGLLKQVQGEKPALTTQGIAPRGELDSSGSRSGSAAPGELAPEEDWVDPQEKLLAGFLGEKS